MNIYFQKRPNSIQRWHVRYYIQFSVQEHTSKFNSAAKELKVKGFTSKYEKLNRNCYCQKHENRPQSFMKEKKESKIEQADDELCMALDYDFMIGLQLFNT